MFREQEAGRVARPSRKACSYLTFLQFCRVPIFPARAVWPNSSKGLHFSEIYRPEICHRELIPPGSGGGQLLGPSGRVTHGSFGKDVSYVVPGA